MNQIEGVLTQKDRFLKPSTNLVTNLVSGRRLSGSLPGLFVPEQPDLPPKPRPNFFKDEDFKPYWTSIDDSGTKSNDEAESGKKPQPPANISDVRKAFLNRKNRFTPGGGGGKSFVNKNQVPSKSDDEKTKSTISLTEQLSKIELPKTPTLSKLWITPSDNNFENDSESEKVLPDCFEDDKSNFVRKNRNRLSLPACKKERKIYVPSHDAIGI